MNIGEKIKELRKKKGYTQQQLADIVGVQRAAIHKYEKNIVSPSIEMLDKISEALGIPITVMLSYNEFEKLYDNEQEEKLIENYRKLIPIVKNETAKFIENLAKYDSLTKSDE